MLEVPFKPDDDDNFDHKTLCDGEQLDHRLVTYHLMTSDGRPHGDQKSGGDQKPGDQKPGGDQTCWVVVLSTDGNQIRRDLWFNHQPWCARQQRWQPEGTIWPSWPASPADEASSSESALSGAQRYWAETGNRLRDSAKWMATVLGAALAAVLGTSPLALAKSDHFGTVQFILAAIGLLALGITLFLIMQVMRPQAVTFTDVQSANLRKPSGALGRWQDHVVSYQDLYLPSGVRCLTSLRQSMIIEKMTLMALALAHEDRVGRKMACDIEAAQAARAARLAELRSAAASIAAIGEYYATRTRSTWATYGGIASGLIGTAAIIAAFA